MKRFSTFLTAIFSLVFVLSAQTSATSTNLMLNASAESGATNSATNWSKGSWGTLTSSYTVPNSGAQDGTRSLKVTVTKYKSGDAKWMPDLVGVTPSATYEASLWYKANVSTEVDVAFKLTNGTMQYVWLATAPSSSTTWKQTKVSFTVPSNVVSAQIFQAISKNGWVQTDNYSLVNTIASKPTPTPTPVPVPTPTPPVTSTSFSRPLVSIEFDDGWSSAYTNGLPLVESFGWKPTQYVITETPGWQDYM
ncbi:MAG TPA: carbohydrate binding domain-containing protein, partial [Candidatus Saccharibacteria bacterium]|nr:carbohydrate binding domain-containing protein [Candidatus Saccharibacteria bacterium]